NIKEYYSLSENKNTQNSRKSIFLQTKDCLKFINKNRVARYIIIASIFISIWICFCNFNSLWQPFLKELGLEEYKFGFIITISGILGIIAPYLSKLFKSNNKENRLVAYFVFGLIIISFFSIFANNYIFGAVIFILLMMLQDIYIPLRENIFQNSIPSKIRATTISFRSLIMSIGFIIATPIATFIAQNFGLRYTIGLSGILLIPAIILYYKIK
ncbi:MAG: MFS transporter, partial [archaeon]